MRDRLPLINHFQEEAYRAKQDKQHQQSVESLQSLENTTIEAFNRLVAYLDKKITKTEVINQLESIATPDVEKVVKELEKLDKRIEDTKLDLKPLVEALKAVQDEISTIPKENPTIPAPLDKVAVTNLAEIKLDTSSVEKAIKALKLDVKAPVINTEKVDLKPLQDLMLDLLKAVNKQKLDVPDKIKISNLKDVPLADLSKLEKKVDEANRHLKEIAEKKFGGGGGGGESVLAFPLYANMSTTVAVSGAIKTITETDGTKTHTIVIDSTDANNKVITESWS